MSILSTAAPWDLVAQGYSETTRKFFRGYVAAALERAELRRDHDIVDVACGPGTLAIAAASNVASVKAVDFSQNMIAMLRESLAKAGITNVEPHLGDGQNLPYSPDTFDAAFSMFGLMFFPDRAKGYGEIVRTLKPGGRVCISSWAPVECSPFMQVMFGAMKAIKPDLPDPLSDADSLENPEFFEAEMTAASFKAVKVDRVTTEVTFNSAEEFWETMIKGAVPVAMMRQSMSEEQWSASCAIAINEIDRAVGTFPTALSADAWLATGTK